MTENEIRTIMEAGIEVGAHGWAHRDLRGCSNAELHEEIFDSRQEMQRRFGVAPDFFAYPYGKGSTRLQPLLAEAGYRGAVTIFSNEPTGEAYDLRYRENSLKPGQHYYYVRVEQKDGNVAWSSPIWVKYQ